MHLYPEQDTDKIVKTQQGANNFFVGFHNDVDSRADTFVNKLWKTKVKLE